jgi:serine/threonine-protein kinase PknG
MGQDLSAPRCLSTPGCTGAIEDGYCTECGLAPRKATATAASGSVTNAGSPRTGTTGTASSARTGTTGTGSARTGSARSASSRRIGAGLVSVPPVQRRDPATAVLDNPKVPEDKRYCASCGEKVGRSRDGRPGRPEGFCPNCGQRYSFAPKLHAGDLIAGQYQVAGCLAHGGLGWIYLATDRNVSDRWVVLKGLLDSGDAAAAAVAVAETRFLAEVEHPNIVKIFNFVEHHGASYIVMEYVGGSSLKDQLKARRDAAGGRPDPLPLAQAIAYILEILPAFGYLHEHGLLFCDFKPDNIIQTPEQLKLIDLGAVVRAGDDNADIYGTVGFQAPEVGTAGASVESDLYTVARSLAVLSTDFRGYQSTFAHALPDRSDVEVYARFESYHRFLQRATATDPAKRFHSADEMAEQLLGVLREVLAADGDPHPAPSRLFTVEMRPDLTTADWRSLPFPLPEIDDPAATYLASVTGTDPAQLLTLLDHAPEPSLEIELRAVRALIDTAAASDRPNYSRAQARLDAAVAAYGATWRTTWFAGVLALATGRDRDAMGHFDAVAAVLPGELAPKLALATAAERSGDLTRAAGYYDTVSMTDPAFTTGCAGLARCRSAAGDRRAAVDAYARIPSTSAAHVDGQVGAIRALIGDGASMTDLDQAAQLLSALQLPATETARLRVDLYEKVLAEVLAGAPLTPVLFGSAPKTAGSAEHTVRVSLETAYRTLGRAAEDAEKIRLIDAANTVRPRTLT